MKNNNRNRKLKFIREKNNLRLGIHIYRYSRKLPRTDKNENVEHYLDWAKDELYKKFKLKLRNNEIRVGQDGVDFIMDTRTLIITLCNRRRP